MIEHLVDVLLIIVYDVFLRYITESVGHIVEVNVDCFLADLDTKSLVK